MFFLISRNEISVYTGNDLSHTTATGQKDLEPNVHPGYIFAQHGSPHAFYYFIFDVFSSNTILICHCDVTYLRSDRLKSCKYAIFGHVWTSCTAAFSCWNIFEMHILLLCKVSAGGECYKSCKIRSGYHRHN